MEELWKDIENTDGMYRVSSFGRVIVHDFRAKGYWSYLTVSTDPLGYKSVNIYYDGLRKKRSIHRLVGEAFLPNPNSLPVINHKDQNPGNNNLDNLEWCSVQYNSTYADAVARRAARITGVYRSNDAVAQYTMEGDFVAVHKSSRDASFALCQSRTKIAEAIVQVCRGARNHCFGYQWRYAFDGYPKKLTPYIRTDMIEQLSLSGEHIAYYKSSYEAQKATGAQPAQILKCCKGQRKQSAGYLWKFYAPNCLVRDE